mmetsp:Transcript_13105/g.38511  ORF Transcript_13105/g.38511 Transcript_13105/m.38511 type:complete len:276 (-) Transcript_13105:429-1256(-)
MPRLAIALSWRWMAFWYLSLRSMEVAASQDQRSASARALTPICRRSAGSRTSFSTCLVKSSAPSSPGWARSPVDPWLIRSGTPPARTPTGGTPEAMDSSTTKPSVSESLGSTNTSADAKAADNSAPRITPVKRTRSSATRSANSFSKRPREGPPPTTARCTSGSASRVVRSCWMRFDSHTRPTYSRSGRSALVSGSTPPRRSRIAASLYSGENLSVSTPFGQTSTFFTPLARSSSASCGEVVSVRSARLWCHRINAQAAASSQPNQLTGRRYSRA